jgi:hypothetical protein
MKIAARSAFLLLAITTATPAMAAARRSKSNTALLGC